MEIKRNKNTKFCLSAPNIILNGILKCFIDFKFIDNEEFNYLNNIAHLNVTKRTISKF